MKLTVKAVYCISGIALFTGLPVIDHLQSEGQAFCNQLQSDHKCNFTGVLLLQACSKNSPIFSCDQLLYVKQMIVSYPGPILQAPGCDSLIPSICLFHFHFQIPFHCHFLLFHMPDRCCHLVWQFDSSDLKFKQLLHKTILLWVQFIYKPVTPIVKHSKANATKYCQTRNQYCPHHIKYFVLPSYSYFFTAIPILADGNTGTVVGVAVALVVVIIIMGVVIGVLVARNRCSVQQHAV